MSASYKLYSHVFENGNKLTLNEHLNRVANIATLEAIPKYKDIVKKICLCHDFAKSTSFFQQYLLGGVKTEKARHGLLSALFAYFVMPNEWKMQSFLIVKRHHGDMGNKGEYSVSPEEFELIKTQLADIVLKASDEINNIYKGVFEENVLQQFNEWIKKLSNAKLNLEFMKIFNAEEKNLGKYTQMQYIYSLLLYADKTSLIRKGEPYYPKSSLSYDCVEKYINQIRNKMIAMNPDIVNSDVFQLREQVFLTLKNTITSTDISSNRLFSLNIPTGTGKTLMAFYAALYLAERVGNGSQIIYSLPFTSVIDQNYSVFCDVFNSSKGRPPKTDEVMKFHSLTSNEYTTNELDLCGYNAEFLMGNWQSSIVATTFVAVCNAFFKGGENSSIHRMLRFAGNILILDELQSLRREHFDLLSKIIKYFCDNFGLYVIMVTATMPILFDKSDITELVPNKKDIFKQLDRIELHNESDYTTDLETFIDIVHNKANQSDSSVLVVLNTVKVCKQVFYESKERLPNRKIYCLNSEIYPKLRLDRINEIKNNPKGSIIVSTQLIEAGVDIDIDVIFRDFAPLDSINQTAGRGNRNGIKTKSEVYLYNLVNQNLKPYSNMVYEGWLLSITREILTGLKVIPESSFYELSEKYYTLVNERKSNDTSNELLKYAINYDFAELRKNFEVIPNDYPKENVIIKTEVADRLLEKVAQPLSYDELLNIYKDLNQYKIQISKRMYDSSTINIYKLNNINVLDLNFYNNESGIVESTNIML